MAENFFKRVRHECGHQVVARVAMFASAAQAEQQQPHGTHLFLIDLVVFPTMLSALPTC